MIVLRRLQEQQLIQRWQILVEEVAGGSHSHLHRTKQRLWMHVKRTNTSKILNLSPDTDISLPLQHGSGKNIVIYFSVHSTLKNWSTCTCQLLLQYYEWPQPLSHPTPVDTSNFQTMFVATGCDYVSFLVELVKPPSWDTSFSMLS